VTDSFKDRAQRNEMHPIMKCGMASTASSSATNGCDSAHRAGDMMEACKVWAIVDTNRPGRAVDVFLCVESAESRVETLCSQSPGHFFKVVECVAVAVAKADRLRKRLQDCEVKYDQVRIDQARAKGALRAAEDRVNGMTRTRAEQSQRADNNMVDLIKAQHQCSELRGELAKALAKLENADYVEEKTVDGMELRALRAAKRVQMKMLGVSDASIEELAQVIVQEMSRPVESAPEACSCQAGHGGSPTTDYSPGEWEYVEDIYGSRVVVDGVAFSAPYRLAPGSGLCPRQAADNRLIAAAPKLLTSLRKVVAISDRDHEAWDAAKAAIAEARGGRRCETDCG
jgi:hypothetical protein